MTTQSNSKKHQFAMTLRLDDRLAEDLEDIAFSLSLSRAAFIRRSLTKAIRSARESEVQISHTRG